jgi:hypothetical protein
MFPIKAGRVGPKIDNVNVLKTANNKMPLYGFA